MNTSDTDPDNAAPTALESLENQVREHPVSTLLLVAGAGVAAVLLARALVPSTPQSRAMEVLEDIQERLAELADDGMLAMRSGADRLSELPFDRTMNRLSRGLKGLFHC